MEADHPYYENIVKDERYQNEPKPEEFPMFESLKLTIARYTRWIKIQINILIFTSFVEGRFEWCLDSDFDS